MVSKFIEKFGEKIITKQKVFLLNVSNIFLQISLSFRFWVVE